MRYQRFRLAQLHAGLKRMASQVLRHRHSATIGRLEFTDRQHPFPGRHVDGVFCERGDLTGSRDSSPRRERRFEKSSNDPSLEMYRPPARA